MSASSSWWAARWAIACPAKAGLDLTFSQLDAGQKAQIAAIAAGFTGLLSLCNIGGRFAWASFSDRLGR